MDSVLKKAVAFLSANRYVVLVLVIGLLFLLLPASKESEVQTVEETVRTEDIQEQLTEILCAIDGVGKVQVMLTAAAGEQVIYQNDESSTSTDTVIITDADRADQGLVKQVIPPTYLGAIIVCQGADSALVRLNVVDAVSKVTGLSADRIAVLKMK